MKKLILLLIIALISSVIKAQVNPNLVDIPPAVFVNEGQTDFENLLTQNASIKEKVKILHAYNELSHDLIVQFNSFEEYWNRYSSQWYFIRFKNKNDSLLLFKGIKNNDDEREYVELYNVNNKRNNRVLFSEVGKVLAYKIHPRTQEIILYVHK